jgi:hypothetical protein
MDKSRKGTCRECKRETRLYGVDLCRNCYIWRKKEAFLLRGISFPKRLGMRPQYWTFELLQNALRKP